MTPTVQKSTPTKHWAPDTPHDSGHLPDMHWHHTGVEAMFALSEAVTNSFSVESGPVVIPPVSPEQMTKAIQIVEEKEGEGGSDLLMQAVDLFHSDSRNPIAYLAFSKKEMKSIWLHCELDQVASSDDTHCIKVHPYKTLGP